MHCFVFLSLLSHYSTAVFTRVPFFDRKAKGVKGLGPFSDLCMVVQKYLSLGLCQINITIAISSRTLEGDCIQNRKTSTSKA